jgi:hypothetical protein
LKSIDRKIYVSFIIKPWNSQPNCRRGKAKPERLEFIRREFERDAREVSREEFRGRLTQMLAERFPDETMESLNASPDLGHSLSGNYFAGSTGHHDASRSAIPRSVAAFSWASVARWDDGCVFFGIGDAHKKLNAVSRAKLKRQVHDLEVHRHPLAEDPRHSLYRAQPERWMESSVREDVTRVDATLDQRFVYAQVFANAGGEHGILDLLTVTRSGRLAIIELKASEHIHLPLQAADYWLRVRRHLENGEITRYGYFPGLELQHAPPLVYLVAPALRFHPSADDLLDCLSPEIEIVRVVMRQ